MKEEIYRKASRATLALEASEQILKEKHDRILNTLKSEFRSGNLDLAKFSGLLGQLVAVDDIKISLTSDIKRADKITKDIK